MTIMAETKYQNTFDEARLLEVVRKDDSGKVVRISRYHVSKTEQRPVSELIYAADGLATLYLYDDKGEAVSQVIQFDNLGVVISQPGH